MNDTHTSSRDYGSIAEPKPSWFPDFQYRVLTIGINRYQRGWPSLNNAELDATELHRILCEKYGFIGPEPLLGSRATREAILAAVEAALLRSRERQCWIIRAMGSRLDIL
jgi:hypothetical protein